MTTQLRALVVLALLMGIAVPALAQRIYVANSAEATVSEIDIVQEREIARFRTWTGDAATQQYNLGSNQGPAPSRIVVDSVGNVYVLNRTWPVTGNPNARLPILWKIRPIPATGFPTSHDANSSGAIDLLDDTEVLPLTVNFLPAPPGQPRQVDPAGIKDGRIEWGMEIGDPAATSPSDLGSLGRSLCMDLNGFLWVGLHISRRYYKVNPANGQTILPAVSTVAGTNFHTPYGCVVDTNGRLWSASSAFNVAEIDTTFGTSGTLIDVRPHSGMRNYGISARRDCVRGTNAIYLSEWTAPPAGKTHITFPTSTPAAFSTSPTLTRANSTIIPNFQSFAIAVDLDGNIISGSVQGLVVKYDPAGNVLWDTNTPPAGPTVPATDLHGMVIDAQNNVWAVHRNAQSSTVPQGSVVKYRGTDGKHLKTITIGREPYTYGNTLPPNCPCAAIGDTTATCQSLSGAIGIFNYSFTFFNKNPFGITATSMTVTGNPPIASVTPGPFSPVPPNGQGTATGTFTVNNPVPGDRVCLDIKLEGHGESGDFCCPSQEVCFTLPECKECLKAVGVFKCRPNGTRYLELTITNNGPGPATSVQVASNTPGVTVTPYSTAVSLPVGGPSATVILAVTGASAGQPITLTVSINGPPDPLTGAFKWCCNTTIVVQYPKQPCWWWIDGEVILDSNVNGIRDAGERGLADWTVTLTGTGIGTRTVQTDGSGVYRFEDVPAGQYRISVNTPAGWRPTIPERGIHEVIVEGESDRRYVFGFRRAGNP